MADRDDLDSEQLVLSEMLNTVLDKGVVVGGTVTISIADVDLLHLDLRLLLASMEAIIRSAERHSLPPKV